MPDDQSQGEAPRVLQAVETALATAPRVSNTAPIVARPPMSPWVVALASFLLPGAGQALAGRFWMGTLLLVLSFVNLPVSSWTFFALPRTSAVAILLVLLAPWLYSMADAARVTAARNHRGEPATSRRGMIGMAVLLLVVFPLVALAFCTVTLFVLPVEFVQQIADVTEQFKRAIGLGQ